MADARVSRAKSAKLLDSITEEIQDLKRGAVVQLYRLGARLAQVQDDELYLARDFDSFEDYLKRGACVGRSTAYKLIRVSKLVNEAIAARYGIEKVEAVRRYIEATPADERPADVFTLQIRVREDDGSFGKRSLHEADTEDIEEAIRLLTEAKAGGHSLPKKIRANATALARDLVEAGIPVTSVKMVRRRDGEAAFNFNGVALKDIAQFAKTVGRRFGGVESEDE